MLSFLFWMDILLIILFILCGFLLSRETNGIILYFIGLFFSQVLNFFLKEWIKEPRPNPNSGYYDYGMPSNHSQTAFYSIGCLFAVYYYKNKETTIKKDEKILITTILITIALAIVWGRVYYQYHTLKQVLIGSIIGFLIGFFLFREMMKSIGFNQIK